MTSYNSLELLSGLQKDIDSLQQRINTIQQYDNSILNRQPAPGKWSVAQIIEHLNSYNRYYLPEIERSLNTKDIPFNKTFKPGLIGNYFTNMMAPKSEQVTNKMKAPKDHTPAPALDSRKVIAEFIAGQLRLAELLKQAEKTDIGRLKVPISISRFIKLKLGDTLRFLITHQQRHFLQIERVFTGLDVSGLKMSSSANM
jgi:uncharacterized damage-inducible protein DinB